MNKVINKKILILISLYLKILADLMIVKEDYFLKFYLNH